MPTYQYQCKNCGHELEELQSFAEAPLVRCPNCHMDTLARVIGGGGGLIFKGTGFYLTDYKKSSVPPESRPKSNKDDEKKTNQGTPSTQPPKAKPSEDSAPPSPKKD